MSDRAIGTRRIVEASNSRVMSGPFEGMLWAPERVSWGDGDLGSRLLGIYEQELHPVIEQIVHLEPRRIVNVGCAEGYYAVGLARRLPHTQVIAIDHNDAARSYTLANAADNSVTVSTSKSTPEPEAGDVWIVDIEGGEYDLLDPEKLPALADCHILVELHEWTRQALEDTMLARFHATHDMLRFESSLRDPNAFEVCRVMPDAQKWAVVSEGRPQSMTWLWLTKR